MSNVNHPKHYNSHPSGVECIDLIEHMSLNLGTAVKYLWRMDDKANKLEDLKKSAFLVKRERERNAGGRAGLALGLTDVAFRKEFLATWDKVISADNDPLRASAFRLIVDYEMGYSSVAVLMKASEIIERMIRAEEGASRVEESVDIDTVPASQPEDHVSALEAEASKAEMLLLRANLVRIRTLRGLSVEDVAERMGISRDAVINGVERPDSDPHLSTVRRYSMAVGALVSAEVSVPMSTPTYNTTNHEEKS